MTYNLRLFPLSLRKHVELEQTDVDFQSEGTSTTKPHKNRNGERQVWS